MANYRPLVIVAGQVMQLSDSDVLYCEDATVNDYLNVNGSIAVGNMGLAGTTFSCSGVLGIDASFGVLIGDTASSYQGQLSVNADRSGSGIQMAQSYEGTITSTDSHAYGSWHNTELVPANNQNVYGTVWSWQVDSGAANTIAEVNAAYVGGVSDNGTGTVNTCIGLRLKTQNAGSLANWSLYCEGDAYFGSDVVFGAFTLTYPTADNQILQATGRHCRMDDGH